MGSRMSRRATRRRGVPRPRGRPARSGRSRPRGPALELARGTVAAARRDARASRRRGLAVDPRARRSERAGWGSARRRCRRGADRGVRPVRVAAGHRWPRLTRRRSSDRSTEPGAGAAAGLGTPGDDGATSTLHDHDHDRP